MMPLGPPLIQPSATVFYEGVKKHFHELVGDEVGVDPSAVRGVHSGPQKRDKLPTPCPKWADVGPLHHGFFLSCNRLSHLQVNNRPLQ
jgi:hypothetical protein